VALNTIKQTNKHTNQPMNYLSLSKWSIDGVRRNAIPHHVIFVKHAAKSVISTGVDLLFLLGKGESKHITGAPASTPGFRWGSYCSIFSFICMFCRSLFVLLNFFFLPLSCLNLESLTLIHRIGLVTINFY
jgi:hypothetical protein